LSLLIRRTPYTKKKNANNCIIDNILQDESSNITTHSGLLIEVMAVTGPFSPSSPRAIFRKATPVDPKKPVKKLDMKIYG
jgi:hypothetical protein